MPELPDLTIYLEHLEQHIGNRTLTGIRISSPFLLRTVSPTTDEVVNRRVIGVGRMAKQRVIELEGEIFLVMHLMISGRLQWGLAGAAVPKRIGLAAFDFDSGTLLFTEVSKKKRASLRLVRGRSALACHVC